MGYVRIESGGLFAYRWNGDRQKNVRRRVKRSRVLTHLRETCMVKEGTTLRDLFRMVASYKLLKAFLSQYSWCREIDAFHAQAEEPMRSENSDGVMLTHLAIRRIVNWHSHQVKGKPPTTYLDSHVDFSGVGVVRDEKAYREAYRSEPPEQKTLRYSVSYSPMYDLADLPLRLEPTMRILDFRSPDGIRESVEAESDFSLLEVLDAIYDDISFHGGPAENAAFLQEMRETVDRIENGEEPLVAMDDDMNDIEPGGDA